MAKKETAPKKETTEKKPRAPRKSSKKTEVIAAVKEEILEEPAATKILPIKSIKIGEVIPDEGLKIRSGPGINFDKVGKLKKNDEVEVLEEKNGFVRIGHDQWCMACHIGGI